MDRDRMPGLVLAVMKNLNMVILLYITGITAYSLRGYVHENSALDFMLRIKGVPMEAWKLPVVAAALYVCLLLLLSIRCERNIYLAWKTAAEMAVAFLIVRLLNFNYTGVVLLIIADTMSYFADFKKRVLLIAAACAAYIVWDYNLMSVWFAVDSLETLWGYFRGDVLSVMLGVNNIFGSLNTLVFIIYMAVLIMTQVSEKERILSLNRMLNEANEELTEANIKLEEYAKESEKAAETRERNRLAREIHDTLGHSLTGIATGIDACVMLMDVAPDATKAQMRAIADVARQGIKDVRRSVKALRPDVLETTNLGNALNRMVDEMSRSTGVRIDYRCDLNLNCFNKDEEDVIYRIVQECITNSIRHGKADRIEIDITREYNMLKMTLKDNGIGCADVHKGFGLHHMEERLDMLNGTLSCNGENGFLVEAQIPIRWGTEEEKHD